MGLRMNAHTIQIRQFVQDGFVLIDWIKSRQRGRFFCMKRRASNSALNGIPLLKWN